MSPSGHVMLLSGHFDALLVSRPFLPLNSKQQPRHNCSQHLLWHLSCQVPRLLWRTAVLARRRQNVQAVAVLVFVVVVFPLRSCRFLGCRHPLRHKLTFSTSTQCLGLSSAMHVRNEVLTQQGVRMNSSHGLWVAQEQANIRPGIHRIRRKLWEAMVLL